MWHESSKTMIWQIIVLKNTIEKLKSPALIAKYEQRGREQAEKEFKKII